MRGIKCKSPPQGLFNWKDVVKYLEEIGALNKKYDSDLDGVIDLSSIPLIPDSQLDFSFAWEKVTEISETGVSAVSITGLTGDTDKYYMIISSVEITATTGVVGYIQLNDDITIANYLMGGLGIATWPSAVGASGQSFGSTSGVAGMRFAHFSSAVPAFSIYFINAAGVTSGTTSYVIGVGLCMNIDGSGDRICYGAWKKQSEVTSIKLFTNPATNGNFTVQLFKPKW